jgi:hypothetical protein
MGLKYSLLVEESTMFNRGPVSRGIAQHPFIIKKLDELPEPLLRLAHNYSHLFDAIDFMLVIPNQSFLKGFFGRRFAPQQALLFYPDGILHLQDAPAPDLPGQAVLIEAKNLRCLVSSLLLLYGKLEIFAEQSGSPQKIEVEYNTVAHDLMKPYLQRFLRASWQTRPAVPDGLLRFELPQIDQLPYKFQSGLRIYALQPQEELCGVVFQPEIREPHLGFFRRKITPNSLFALTDQQVVLIQEETASTSNYGWVFSYYPRQHIKQIQVNPVNEWQAVQIQAGSIAHGNIKTVILDPVQAKEWMHIVEGIK